MFLADPASAAEYGRLKKQLAARFPTDIDEYIDGKTDFADGSLFATKPARQSVSERTRMLAARCHGLGAGLGGRGPRP